jgi:SulP family sulfate permease
LIHYRPQDFVGDMMAGTIVAIMLVPQSMAYALLAGLPPQVGLYASILPLILYPLLGTSRVLAVGPVAIVSLLVASGLGELAAPGTSEYLTLAIALAFLAGTIQLVMGLAHLGFLVNWLSHAVISGFTSAAAIVIGVSQLKHLLGITIPSTESFFKLLGAIAAQLPQTNPVTLAIGLASVALLVYCNRYLGAWLLRHKVPAGLVVPITKSGPLLAVAVSTWLVWGLSLSERIGVKVVGTIPAGLPPLTLPVWRWADWQTLLPTALAITFVGFMESIAVAKSLASKRRQKIDADRELLGLGAANLGAAFTGGYPVTGGFSRSVVNFSAGANTGLASIVTALLIALTLLLLTPLFYFLPQAALAAIIVVAVAGLVDIGTLRWMWRYDKADAASAIVTFVAVLGIGIEQGILVGAAASLLLYLWRTSRPHMAVIGRVGDSEHFRNVLRHTVKTYPHILAVRVDESLYFANTKYLEDRLLRAIAEQPDVRHLVLVCSAINAIDASALETLENLLEELRDAGVALYLAEVKGPVMDRLQAIGFADKLGRDRIFLSTHAAMLALGG